MSAPESAKGGGPFRGRKRSRWSHRVWQTRAKGSVRSGCGFPAVVVASIAWALCKPGEASGDREPLRLGPLPMKRSSPNPKRKLRRPAALELDVGRLAQECRYVGNPQHKRNPGDFGLTPPSGPREGKTLCDGVQVFTRAGAQGLLSEGLRRGLISVQTRGGWPQNVWAVASNGTPLEAMLDNQDAGTYHGYPMLSDDPLRDEVLRRWSGP